MPGSSDFRISPTVLLILMPLRSNGMWLPVTITPARPVARECAISAGVGILPAFSTWQPASTMAWRAGAHDAIGARPQIAGEDDAAPGAHVAAARQVAERPLTLMYASRSVMSLTRPRRPLVPNARGTGV